MPRRGHYAAAGISTRRGEDMFPNMKALGKFLAAAIAYLRRGDTFSPQREDYAAAARFCFKKRMLSVSFSPRRRVSFAAAKTFYNALESVVECLAVAR